VSEGTPNAGVIAGAALVAVIAAVGAGAALSHIARPPGFEGRLAAASKTIARAQALSRPGASRSAHGAHAVCPGPGAENLDAIRATLVAAAARAGLPQPEISLAALGGGDNDTIEPVRVNLRSEGPYNVVLNLLGELDTAQPELFVDSLDLKPKTTAVDLRLSGKVFCWTVAP
jgi:Type II secretion system (T2SS), protein M subtype b